MILLLAAMLAATDPISVVALFKEFSVSKRLGIIIEGESLINDGIATTEEIDDAIRYGFGLRWAQMGMFETYRIAGGDDGLEQFIEQFGPALKWPWTKLTDVPDLSKELISQL